MLVPCPQCNRHVKDAETRCPFCAASSIGKAAVLTAALTLAACGGESKGTVTPPPDPTAPTATATGTTPTQPTAAPTSTTSPTASTTASAPQPDRPMAPRYGGPPQRLTPPDPPKQ